MSKKRSLSGIKPTGFPHLGNYLGMIRPAIELQEDYEAFYFAADYHALTTVKDPEALRDSVHQLTAYFLAFGLDPERAAFFRQSDIPEVTELTWILSCVTHMGLLERAHAYKAAKDEGRANEINHGIFAYPVLMASDILIYDSDVVPVGRDQVQHLEMTRDMAQKFNHAFGGEYLKLPEAIVRDEVAVVPGTDGRKMSKSYDNLIEPLAPPDQLKEQCMGIETDSTPLDEPKDP
ncbi:MAG: tryptophan--tRNA ligase, partial [Persicimonas sp.]